MPHMTARRCRAVAASLVLATLVAPSLAHEPLAGLRFDSPQTVQYRCDDGQRFTVRYYNSPDNQIALVPVDGKTLLFVSVLSASGARYAHGVHEWWTKGREARLTDLTRGENAAPLHGICREAG